MKFLTSLLFLCLNCLEGICQYAAVSDTAYSIKFGKYFFEVTCEYTNQTSYEFDLSSSCSNYSEKETTPLKTILFKNDTFTIQLPETSDTILYLNCDTAEEMMKIVVRNQIKVNKIVDTVTLVELIDMIEKDIKVYYGNIKLENISFNAMLILDSGTKRIISNAFVNNRTNMYEQIKLLSSGGYFIIYGIFYNYGRQNGLIEGAIGWRIE